MCVDALPDIVRPIRALLRPGGLGLLSALMLLSAGTLRAAENQTRITARITPDSVQIGDHFTLRVEVTKDLMTGLGFPEFHNSRLGDSIEILKEGPVDTLSRDGRSVTLVREYTLTCFEAADYRMGRFPLLAAQKNRVDTLWSIDSMRVRVTTFAIDTTTQTIFDIKKPLPMPLRLREFGGYLLWALLGALLLAVLIYLGMRWAKHRPILGTAPSIDPPHVVAIRQLEKLHTQKLWQSGKEKFYYTRLTDILRQYLEDRYRFPALENTSSEILDQLKKQALPERELQRMAKILQLSDVVKFAKHTPQTEQNEEMYQQACFFVEETKESIQEEVIGNDDLTPEERKGVKSE